MAINSGIGHVWAANAGEEGRPAGVGPVWIENADQLGSKLPEPESGDVGKVLGVLNSDGDIGWVPDQEGMAQVQADWDQSDPTQVSYIANKPTIPSLDGYATEQWVENKNYITSADIPPIPSDVVTSGELATVSGDIVSQIPSLSGYATETWVQNQGYITSVPSEYVTDTEMSTYVDGETSAFITSADLPEVPEVKDLVAGNGIDITTTSADVTISVDNDIFDGFATETWTAQNYFPIDGLQVVSSSAEASAANVIYIVTGSNSPAESPEQNEYGVEEE